MKWFNVKVEKAKKNFYEDDFIELSKKKILVISGSRSDYSLF